VTKQTRDGLPVHRFRDLLAHLATPTCNAIQPAGGLPSIDQLAQPTRLQTRAFELLGVTPSV
jgi:hypothetical protein